MTLFTKSIFDPISPQDGVRISVMSRHTLEDGKTNDERITPASFTIHMPNLAPDSADVGAFYRALASGRTREELWPEFAKRYLRKLQLPDQHARVVDLASAAKGNNFTMLCAEGISLRPYCHRFLLAEEMKRANPKLLIRHL